MILNDLSGVTLPDFSKLVFSVNRLFQEFGSRANKERKKDFCKYENGHKIKRNLGEDKKGKRCLILHWGLVNEKLGVFSNFILINVDI